MAKNYTTLCRVLLFGILILGFSGPIFGQDSDGDGLSDADEAGLGTDPNNPCDPYTFSAACDTDGDGVANAYDQCPNTPTGTLVNYQGCPSPELCESTDLPPVNFEPSVVWTGENVDARETPLVGDVTGDGVPNVIVDNYRDTVYILNGITGATEYTIPITVNHPTLGIPITDPIGSNNSANAIADVDRDGYGEIFLLASAGLDSSTADEVGQWIRLDFDGTNWTQTVSSGAFATNHRFVPHLADFNGDGTVELYSGTQIWYSDFTAQGNDLIAEVPADFVDLGGSMAIDILPDAACADCQGLELVMGRNVYSVDVANSRMTLEVTANPATLSLTDFRERATSIADMDLDGDLDVVYTVGYSAENRLVIWDGQTPQVLLNKFLSPRNQVSRANIADFDGDGYLEVGLHYQIDPNSATPGTYAVVDDILTTNGDLLWSIITTDQSSTTGSTVYDFDGDGDSEVVYRDEDNLRILDGRTGQVIYISACQSGTRWEYPVVADVNGDGTTNIICTCTGQGVTVFESNNLPWVPSRSVWNQHGYNVTNVNDDLTIPTTPASNLGFGGQFNNFLKQSSKLNETTFEPELTVADASWSSITMGNQSGCPSSYEVTLTIENTGNGILSADMPISLYRNDPTQAGSNLLQTILLGNQLQKGQTETITVALTEPTPYELFVVLNDSGTLTLPIDLDTSFPATPIPECSYLDNLNSVMVSCPQDEVPAAEDNNFAMSDCLSLINGNVITDDNGQGVDSCSTGCTPTVLEFSVQGIAGTANAGQTIDIPNVGIIMVAANGQYTFDRDNDYVGVVPTITYTLTTNSNLQDSAELNIEVIETPVPQAPSLNNPYCDSFTLPATTVGNYFLAPGGNSPLVDLTLTSTTEIFIYSENPSFPNCFEEVSFTVEINQTPTATAQSISCNADLSTYEVVIDLSSGSISSTSAGNISGNTITDIPTGTDISIIFEENGCSDTLTISAPDCNCPTLEAPISNGDINLCENDTPVNLSVQWPAGADEIRWYNTPTSTTPIGTGENFQPTPTQPGVYRFYAQAFNSISGCASARIELVYRIYNIPIPALISDQTACDGYTLPNLPANNRYFTAANKGGVELSPGTRITQPQTIFIQVDNPSNPNCSGERSFFVDILQTPSQPAFQDIEICSSDGNFEPVVLGLDLGSDVIYDWTPDNDTDGDGVEEPTFSVRKSGIYTLKIYTQKGSFRCTNGIIYSSEVSFLPIPTSISIELTQDSRKLYSSNSITLNAISSNGDTSFMEYALDNPEGPYQRDNTFYDVPGGIHYGYARSQGECGINLESNPILVVQYPTFFSPNGDGTNEFWNVLGLEDLSLTGEVQIHVFDRYGKLLKQILPDNEGWDGTYLGSPMPSADYWFKVYYTQLFDGSNTTVQFNGHFSLIR